MNKFKPVFKGNLARLEYLEEINRLHREIDFLKAIIKKLLVLEVK